MVWAAMAFQSSTESARACIAPAYANARAVMSRSFIFNLGELWFVPARSAHANCQGCHRFKAFSAGESRHDFEKVWERRLNLPLSTQLRCDRSVEAEGVDASVGIRKFAGGGTERERLPVLPVEQVDAPLDMH